MRQGCVFGGLSGGTDHPSPGRLGVDDAALSQGAQVPAMVMPSTRVVGAFTE